MLATFSRWVRAPVCVRAVKCSLAWFHDPPAVIEGAEELPGLPAYLCVPQVAHARDNSPVSWLACLYGHLNCSQWLFSVKYWEITFLERFYFLGGGYGSVKEAPVVHS